MLPKDIAPSFKGHLGSYSVRIVVGFYQAGADGIFQLGITPLSTFTRTLRIMSPLASLLFFLPHCCIFFFTNGWSSQNKNTHTHSGQVCALLCSRGPVFVERGVRREGGAARRGRGGGAGAACRALCAGARGAAAVLAADLRERDGRQPLCGARGAPADGGGARAGPARCVRLPRRRRAVPRARGPRRRRGDRRPRRRVLAEGPPRRPRHVQRAVVQLLLSRHRPLCPRAPCSCHSRVFHKVQFVSRISVLISHLRSSLLHWAFFFTHPSSPFQHRSSGPWCSASTLSPMSPVSAWNLLLRAQSTFRSQST